MSTIVSYCERTGPGLWAEPINAITNVAFLVAAFVSVLTLRRIAPNRPAPASIQLLIGLLVVIGIGSSIFHTVRSWTQVLDVVPIALFVLSYVVIAAHYFYDVPWRFAWMTGPAFLAFVAAVGTALGALGFSDTGRWYVPVLLAILGSGAALTMSREPGRRATGQRLAAVGLLFAVALVFRQLDLPLCSSFPLGTHFIWHLLDATVLYLGVWIVALRWRDTVSPVSATAAAAG
jgi:hypothetical protein